ncbi:hypothetical protein [Cypionkella sp.]|uniref:hypothetical protein n=1 Tax=Cypionkella sp. TaxID=2811411 RepID=UPI0026341CC6|nr:hypothetical protein [Cypionkella sp.]
MTISATQTLKRLLDGPPDAARLEQAFRHLAKWRSELISNTLVGRSGTKVLSGPFRGMDYPVRASEGSRAARLMGSYESSLAPVIEEIVTKAYPVIIDVGSAEGYYAVGLARRVCLTRGCWPEMPIQRRWCYARRWLRRMAWRIGLKLAD